MTNSTTGIELKDVIQMYIGCRVLVDDKEYGKLVGGEYVPNEINQIYHSILIDGIEDDTIMPYNDDFGSDLRVKPILRSMSDITDDEWKVCFELSRGVVDQCYAPEILKRMSTSEIMVILGKKQFVFGFHNCDDNDVRIGYGISFYLKSYLIENNIIVSQKGIESKESWYNQLNIEPVLNIVHIITYLIKQQFDVFGLITSGQAIDKTTL